MSSPAEWTEVALAPRMLRQAHREEPATASGLHLPRQLLAQSPPERASVGAPPSERRSAVLRASERRRASVGAPLRWLPVVVFSSGAGRGWCRRSRRSPRSSGPPPERAGPTPRKGRAHHRSARRHHHPSQLPRDPVGFAHRRQPATPPPATRDPTPGSPRARPRSSIGAPLVLVGRVPECCRRWQGTLWEPPTHQDRGGHPCRRGRHRFAWTPPPARLDPTAPSPRPHPHQGSAPPPVRIGRGPG